MSILVELTVVCAHFSNGRLQEICLLGSNGLVEVLDREGALLQLDGLGGPVRYRTPGVGGAEGPLVTIEKLEGERYLKTVPNGIKEDNLGELPEKDDCQYDCKWH